MLFYFSPPFMEKLFQFLNSVYPISPGLAEYMVGIIKWKELAKKDFLLKAGHVCHNIYFIEKGLLRCFYIKGENEVCSWFMKENDVIVSIESFFLRSVSYESIQALEACTLFYISYEDLYHIYRTYPEFNWTGRELMQNYYIFWTKQLFGMRMQQAPERYKWLLVNFPDLILRVPAKYLASWLGITPVMLSIIKGKRIS